MMQTGFHIIWLKMSPNSWLFLFSFLRADDRMEKNRTISAQRMPQKPQKTGHAAASRFFPGSGIDSLHLFA